MERKPPTLGDLVLDMAGIGIAGALLARLPLEELRKRLPESLRPGEDPRPYLRLLDAAEELRDAREEFREALREWAAREPQARQAAAATPALDPFALPRPW